MVYNRTKFVIRRNRIMRSFFLALALVLTGVFITVPSFAHEGNHQYTTLASDVMNGVDNPENREALKEFVMHAKAHIEETKYIEDFLILLAEFKDRDQEWTANEAAIYLFIFTAGDHEVGNHDPEDHGEGEIAVFNAFNPLIEGMDIHETVDANGVEISHELIDAIERDGFGEYTWDDPRIEGDEVREEGKSPGTSPKVSYVETVKVPGPSNTTFILGSGFYPTPVKSGSNDDGCAIAGASAATGAGLSSLLLNMVLVVSGLFMAVSWRICACGKKINPHMTFKL